MIINFRTIPALVLVVISLVAGACKPSSGKANENDNVSSWSLVEDLRLGSAAGDAPEVFGASIALEASADGTLYVADQQNYRIEVFDSTGVHQRTLGRRGSGPGEVMDLIGVKLHPDGGLWAVDAGNGRYSVFGPDGAPSATLSFQGFHTIPWKGTIDSDGRIHNLILILSDEGPRMAYVTSSETATDTLFLPPYTPVQQQITSPSGEERLVNVPFAPRPQWAVDREGKLWYGFSDEYRIHRIDYSGDTIATIQGPNGTVQLTEGERATAVDLMRGPLGEDTPIEDSWIPRRRPQFESIVVDDRNRIWVGIPLPGGNVGYDVYGADGKMIARAEFVEPAEAPRSMVVRGGHVYTVATDSLGVPSVIRYRIEPSD